MRFDPLYSLGLIHLDGPQGGICLDERDAIDVYARIFIQVQSATLSPADSLDLIHRLITK